MVVHVDGMAFLKTRRWHTGCQTDPTVGAGTVHLQRKLHTDMSERGTFVSVVAEANSKGGLVEVMKHRETRPNRT